MRYFVFDTETTGVSPKDRIVEVAYLEFDSGLNVVQKHESLIDPEMPIPEGATKVHGISDDMVLNAPTLSEWLELPQNLWVKDSEIYFIAHNAKFDFKFFKSILGNGTRVLDTLALARMFYPDATNHKLETLKDYLDIPVNDSHNALVDVEACFGLLKKLIEKTEMGVAALFDLSNKPIKITKMPFGKHKGTALSKLPKDYVSWLLQLPDLDQNLKRSLNEV